MAWQFTVGWAIIFGAGLALEIVALVRRGRGDTLSEHMWKGLRLSPVIWFIALGFFAWLGLHFFVPSFGFW